MVDDIFDNSRPLGRVEVRTGVGRRRRWTEEQKGRIVAASYRAGAVVSEVARRYEISPSSWSLLATPVTLDRLTPII